MYSLLAQNGSGPGAAGAFGGCMVGIIILGVAILIIAGFWKTFEKAGKPGWAAIVPIYNLVVLLEIAGKPLWWILLYLIPLVSFIVTIIVSIEVAKRFGKDVLFGLGLTFLAPIFYPILGFGDAEYQGG
jgi:hypothetical protein